MKESCASQLPFQSPLRLPSFPFKACFGFPASLSNPASQLPFFPFKAHFDFPASLSKPASAASQRKKWMKMRGNERKLRLPSFPFKARFGFPASLSKPASASQLSFFSFKKKIFLYRGLLLLQRFQNNGDFNLI